MRFHTLKSYYMFHKIALITSCLFLIAGSSVVAQTITATGLTTTAVHTAAGSGVVLDSGDYYGSGNDDAFSEFGLTTFNIPDATVTAIGSATLNLTYNDRSFTDGTSVEFFYTPDSAATLGGGFANLAYDPAIETGLNASQFATAPVSLGVFAFDAAADGGSTLSYDLDLTTAGASLLSAVQNGSDFQIIVTSTAAADDITFSGVGNTFDPGDPSLTLSVTSVPEPASLGLIGLGLFGLLAIRRRR